MMRNGLRTLLFSFAFAGASAGVALAEEEDYASKYCGDDGGSVSCGPGNNRQTPGGAGTGNVPHADDRGKKWPKVSGILWKVNDTQDRTKTGGSLNDELLGHHGDEDLRGGGGDDILWGDWDPKGNTSKQRDILRGGAGDDFLYASHGRNTLLGGPGRDYLYAFYGRGVIDCGPGKNDTARVRLNGKYKVRNCERIVNFCSFGSKPGGGCYKPGEKPKKP